MKILPLTPGMDASLLDADKSIFNDLTKKERSALEKSMSGKELNTKELTILNNLNDKFMKSNSKEILTKTNNTLAQHIRPPQLKSHKERVTFWEKRGGAHFLLKIFLVEQINNRIGTDQRAMIKLFRSS